MRSAWRLLAQDFPWILFEGCKAHMLNLVAKDICEKTAVNNWLDYCIKIVKYFRMHVDMVSQVVYIKHNLHLEYAHLFKSAGKDAEVDEAEENLAEESEQENEIGEEMYMFD
uniref:DUF659 domain-containing protein n=1 Tax=Ditylenchus dipsaci TaxID=166011 RepID=A0A915DIT0_9BILA